MLDEAKTLSCITLAFGISDVFKTAFADNPKTDHLAFFLLEKEDKPAKGKEDGFVRLTARNNVYQAFGASLRSGHGEGLERWAAETSTRSLRLNTHVAYIHSKFLLQDPLGDDPIVVTGSANFSAASTTDNDENMLIVRGDKRVADIYFTEFNRLFFHYYFRSVQERTQRGDSAGSFSLFLDETDGWLAKYAPGSLRQKRVDALAGMTGLRDP